MSLQLVQSWQRRKENTYIWDWSLKYKGEKENNESMYEYSKRVIFQA